MKVTKVHWSQWGSGDYDLSGLKMTNAAGQTSEIIGSTRYSWNECDLRDSPIQKIMIYRKSGSDAYMRGAEILYRDGET